jgi:hypothetical protein
MGNDRKWFFKMAVIGIMLMIVTLTCNVNLANPTTDTTYITQTFSALGTEMAEALDVAATQSAEPVEAPSTETTADTRAPVVHSVTPPEGTSLAPWITDKSDAALADQHRANGGENFDQNLFERPFTSGVMDYLPDIDIVTAEFSRSGDWVFINLIMSGQNPAGGMKGVYGIEVDSNMNGRGDFIIYAINPTSTSWSTTGVKAYEDTNHDVGGYTPLVADIHPGNGFETLIFDEGYINDPDAAWARISPSSGSTVQLVFKYSLIRNNDKYMWGAWAGLPEMVDPAWFDYNDHFTHAIAGSSLSELTDFYPLKAFFGWDNTCRWVVGIKNPTGNEPGLCPYTPEPTAGPTLGPGIMVP